MVSTSHYGDLLVSTSHGAENSLEGDIREQRGRREDGGDATANVGDEGQNLGVLLVYQGSCSRDILHTPTYVCVWSTKKMFGGLMFPCSRSRSYHEDTKVCEVVTEADGLVAIGVRADAAPLTVPGPGAI